MKRLIQAVLLALLSTVPGVGYAAAQSATVDISVTVLPSKLVAIIDPNCTFVIAAKETKADCSTSITVAQPTFQFEGWELMLAASDVVNVETGEVVHAKSITVVAYSSFALRWGQPVDAIGGPYIPKQAAKHDLEQPRSVIVAEPGYGIGGYTTTIHFELKVPPKTAPGTYIPTIVATVSNSYAGKHKS